MDFRVHSNTEIASRSFKSPFFIRKELKPWLHGICRYLPNCQLGKYLQISCNHGFLAPVLFMKMDFKSHVENTIPEYYRDFSEIYILYTNFELHVTKSQK